MERSSWSTKARPGARDIYRDRSARQTTDLIVWMIVFDEMFYILATGGSQLRCKYLHGGTESDGLDRVERPSGFSATDVTE